MKKLTLILFMAISVNCFSQKIQSISLDTVKIISLNMQEAGWCVKKFYQQYKSGLITSCIDSGFSMFGDFLYSRDLSFNDHTAESRAIIGLGGLTVLFIHCYPQIHLSEDFAGAVNFKDDDTKSLILNLNPPDN